MIAGHRKLGRPIPWKPCSNVTSRRHQGADQGPAMQQDAGQNVGQGPTAGYESDGLSDLGDLEF